MQHAPHTFPTKAVVSRRDPSIGGAQMFHKSHTSVQHARQRSLSIDEAAQLLRIDHSVVLQAAIIGELPTVREGDRLLIDGPALLSALCQPITSKGMRCDVTS